MAATTSCLMCRDYTRLDELAYNLRIDAVKNPISKIQAEDRVLIRARELLSGVITARGEPQSEGLVQSVTEILVRCGIHKELLTADDLVGRARLISVWIASSVKWEYSNDSTKQEESRSDILIQKRAGYCGQYGQLFCDMFNGFPDGMEQTGARCRARVIKGITKFSTTAIPLMPGYDGHGKHWNAHTWVEIPTSPDKDSSCKWIDPCWMWYEEIEKALMPIHSQWFTNSDATIRRTHQSQVSPLSESEFLNRDLVPFLVPGIEFKIEESSLVPAAPTLPAVPGPTMFSFKLICSHVETVNLPDFWLVPTTDSDLDQVDLMKAIKFQLQSAQAANDQRPIYSVPIDVLLSYGSENELHLAVAFDRKTGTPFANVKPETKDQLKPEDIRWEDIVCWKLKK